MCLCVYVCSVVLHTSFVYCFVVIDNVMELQSRELCGVHFDDDDVFVLSNKTFMLTMFIFI